MKHTIPTRRYADILTHTHTQSDIPFGKNIRSHAGFQAVIAFLSDVLEIRVGNPCGIYGAYPLDRFIAVAVKYRSIQIELINRSEEHTSELQSLMRISYAVSFLNISSLTHFF